MTVLNESDTDLVESQKPLLLPTQNSFTMDSEKRHLLPRQHDYSVSVSDSEKRLLLPSQGKYASTSSTCNGYEQFLKYSVYSVHYIHIDVLKTR